MKIKSKFAVLDVTGKTRWKLSKHFESRPAMGVCPKDLRIPVIIHGYLSGQNSRDDGASIEFNVDVDSVITDVEI